VDPRRDDAMMAEVEEPVAGEKVRVYGFPWP
jgi:hypothetical protein